MIRPILEAPDPILNEIASTASPTAASVGVLLDDMKETMLAARGIGLAAPQVGEPWRVIVVRMVVEKQEAVFMHDTHTDVLEMINPVTLKASDGVTTSNEGCLSVPEMYVNKERFN